ncbi:MAG: lipid-binding SYLF domain-containing protein [Acidobacteriaceae bacterium]|nr:lipid-binding SYLF domain-containing protein [Acidobacteriaceae bacterium]MBV9294068.1 lipid-binding SYLF domain-containing protein [Acidobacteriaceae bacterium]MBV9767915.1 lipid-binding SYLF domain-containing protein [Acidobacteriaceae bacterium]
MKVVVGALLAALISVPVFAQKTAADRLTAATEDLNAMMNASDKGVPQDLLSKASCVVVIPNLKKGGFIVGAEYGKGFFTCRKTSGVGWSAPGSIRISGGKFGLLIGGAETDVIMLVMNPSGMDHLLSDKFQLGGEASAAAGPVGRDASAMTDAELHAEILTYSRSKGLFGGLDLGGAAVTEDKDSNRELYGSELSNKDILNNAPHIPPAAKPFVHTLDRLSSRK